MSRSRYRGRGTGAGKRGGEGGGGREVGCVMCGGLLHKRTRIYSWAPRWPPRRRRTSSCVAKSISRYDHTAPAAACVCFLGGGVEEGGGGRGEAWRGGGQRGLRRVAWQGEGGGEDVQGWERPHQIPRPIHYPVPLHRLTHNTRAAHTHFFADCVVPATTVPLPPTPPNPIPCAPSLSPSPVSYL